MILMIFHGSWTETFIIDNPTAVGGGLSVLGISTERLSAHVARVPKDLVEWQSHYTALCTRALPVAKDSFRRFPQFLGSLEKAIFYRLCILL